MRQQSLLATKLYSPPIRTELVARPRLTERLNSGLTTRGTFSHALTLVSAPAGFGKTTLVTQWLNSARCPATWLSVDERDNDSRRFLTYFVAALRAIEAQIGQGVLSALQSAQPPPPEAVLTSVINDVANLSERLILVLDDYHLIEAKAIHDTLIFLLEHLPPQMHLVIATREDPPLPLARLRGRGQLIELRATELRFTSSEAAEYLNQAMGLDLAAEDIAALEARTEGWITGLHLAAISMQGRKDVAGFIRSFTGSHHFVLDYLVEEVLEQQSESVQSFLLQTSILDRLTGSLCDALRFGSAKSPPAQDRGQATLEMLERANLFIVPLDTERHWYRYHHLFSDLLHRRLRQIQPEQVPALHTRASEWYERNGFSEEAIEHALRGQDFERAAYLVEVHADAIWESGEHTKMYGWLDRLPAELIFSRPELCIYQASKTLRSGQPDAAEQALQAAEKVLNSGIDGETVSSIKRLNLTPNAARTRLLGIVAAMRALMASYLGDSEEIIPHARRALDYLPQDELAWRIVAYVPLGDANFYLGDMEAAYRAQSAVLDICVAAGNLFIILYANLSLAITLRQSGRLGQAQEICQQQVQMAEESGMGHTAVAGWISSIWGEVLAELNDLDGAIHQARKGVALTEQGGDVMMLGWSYLCLMRVLFSRGDLSAAEETIQRIRNDGRESGLPPWAQSQLAAWQARVWLAQGRFEAASQWVAERGLAADGELAHPRETEYITLARILIAQGLPGKATKLLDRLLEAAEGGGRTSRAIEILNLQSLAWEAQSDTNGAVSQLERSLALAKPGGFVRTYVDEGPPMARLLHEAAARGIAPDYAGSLLATFEGAAKGQRTEKEVPSSVLSAGSRQAFHPSSSLVEPLSERELEVLHLIAEGLTNREIAARLFVSLNTVKAHTRNVYGKLGVNNRMQAATKARALGILPPT